MKEQIAEIVEAYWEDRQPALMKLVAERKGQIENILVLEDYYRSGHTDKNLRKAIGSFGSDVMDMASLATVLQQGDAARTLEKERYNRIKTLSQELANLSQVLAKHPPACRFVDLEQGAEDILGAFDDHISAQAKLFRVLRIAQIEARAKYDAAAHDGFFENFNWRHLDNAEMALCPPFVVYAEAGEEFGDLLTGLLPLVTSGRPLKVALVRKRLDNTALETGRAAALKSATDVELLFISLRKVYFAQGAFAHPSSAQSDSASQPTLGGLIVKGLESLRPAVFSIYSGDSHGQSGNGAASRAERALLSRACPQFVYDPDRANDFVSCLDLSANPAVEEVWPMADLPYVTPEGESTSLQRPLSFADFAVGEAALREHFLPPAADLDEAALLPLADYLLLNQATRQGKVPFIYSTDEEMHLVRWVPSQSMVAQTADKMHLWHTLQELGGLRNPHVQAAERKASERMKAENEQALSEQQARLEALFASREQAAVATAMETLALRLTGMAAFPTGATQDLVRAPASGSASGSASAQSSAAASAGAAGAPAAVSEMPWIEPALCTTCDECTNISKKIFAYDANKKAYIKDPRGGPFRDIVRAAEKCSSGAIHPGMPLDPAEKDLSKWIQRAEPYQ